MIPRVIRTGSFRTTLLVWAGTNVVAGLLLAYPLILTELVGRYVVGRLLDAPWTPFERDHDAVGAVALFTLLIGTPLIVVTVVANRWIHRKLQMRGRRAVAYWVVSLALLVAPYLLVR